MFYFPQVPNVPIPNTETAAHYKCDPCQVRWCGTSECWVCGEEGKFLNRILVPNQ